GFFDLLAAFETIDIINVCRHAFQSFRESTVMLQRQNGRRNQYRYLFAICYSFKGSTDSDLGFTETHIPADQSIHWMRRFHVLFQVSRSLFLVWCILIDKGGFQFPLQIGIRTESISRLSFSLSIEHDQVPGYILNLFLGCPFQFLPSVCSQFIHLRNCSFL